MILIQISKWLDRTFTENLYQKHYKKNVRACVLKKTFIASDYALYAVARHPEPGEKILKDYDVKIMESERIKVEIIKGMR